MGDERQRMTAVGWSVVPIPSVGALLAAVVLGAAIVIFMDRIIGLRVLAPMSGVRRICSLLSRIRNEECSDGSSDAGDRDSEPQCRLSRVLEEHNLMATSMRGTQNPSALCCRVRVRAGTSSWFVFSLFEG